MIESVDSVYRPLFTVKFLHNAYQTPKENFFSEGISIVTDNNTSAIFKNYKMDYRFFNDTLICFIQCTPFNPPAPDPKVPSTKINSDIRVRFLLKNSSDFFSKTYVAGAGNKKLYQFSNKINNAGGGNLFLTAPVENHVTAKDYDTGTVVQDGGNLYASIAPVKAADNIAINNTNFWKQLEPLQQVVNNADLQDATTVNADANCFAVLDMYNNGTSNSSYNLFDVNEKLFNPAPLFTIKFEGKF
jgi:hypothetical protein